jgi:hypothetical protein
MGLAGVAQVARSHSHVQLVRQGKVIKETDETRFALLSYFPEEAGPERLQEVGRAHWSIENGQYYRRDRTQDEDRCPVAETRPAISPCFGLWPFSCSRGKPAIKAAKNRCLIFKATFIANLGG